MDILIAVDLQNDFITGALGNEQCAAAVENAAKYIRSFREKGGRIYATLDTHLENYLETREGKDLPVPHCIKGSRGHELTDEIKSALGEDYTPVEKNTFGSKDLPLIIKEDIGDGKIDSFILIGVCTDICVISNAMVLRAFFPEVPIRVAASCCGGVTPESHENALAAMKSCQIIVE